MIETAIGLVVAVVGCGGAGVGLAWLNDRRIAARDRRTPPQTAKAILETRYAKGELDHDEFNTRMHALTYGPPLELERHEP